MEQIEAELAWWQLPRAQAYGSLNSNTMVASQALPRNVFANALALPKASFHQ